MKRVSDLARKYSNTSNKEDLIQEGLIALLNARRTWRAEAQFWTYAKSHVLGAMVRYTTAESSNPACPQSVMSWSSDEDNTVTMSSGEDSIESNDCPADAALELAELTALLADGMIALTDEERKVIRLHAGDGKSLAASARDLGLSNDKVERVYLSAISKLRERVQARL